MSETVNAVASWRDYLEMCKPRVVLLMLVRAIAYLGALFVFLLIDHYLVS